MLVTAQNVVFHRENEGVMTPVIGNVIVVGVCRSRPNGQQQR